MKEMKMTKICFVALALLAGAVLQAGAQDEKPLKLALTTDFAYYPKSDYKASSDGTHFAPLTGAFSGVEARTTFSADYTLPFLQGSSAFTQDNHLTFTAGLELSPVSVEPQLCVTFSPIAFLKLYAGIDVGSGWSVAGFRGMTEYRAEKQDYVALDAFSGCHLYGYGGALLMFDAEALWPGDWHHIIFATYYEVGYERLTGTSKDVWSWKEAYGHANGIVFDNYYLVGYQMPLALSVVAFSAEATGHYRADDYGDYADSYGGSFVTWEIGPLCRFTLGKKDTLTILTQFATRRSFAERHEETKEEPLLTQTGSEWYFERIAASWKHVF